MATRQLRAGQANGTGVPISKLESKVWNTLIILTILDTRSGTWGRGMSAWGISENIVARFTFVVVPLIWLRCIHRRTLFY